MRCQSCWLRRRLPGARAPSEPLATTPDPAASPSGRVRDHDSDRAIASFLRISGAHVKPPTELNSFDLRRTGRFSTGGARDPVSDAGNRDDGDVRRLGLPKLSSRHGARLRTDPRESVIGIGELPYLFVKSVVTLRFDGQRRAVDRATSAVPVRVGGRFCRSAGGAGGTAGAGAPSEGPGRRVTTRSAREQFREAPGIQPARAELRRVLGASPVVEGRPRPRVEAPRKRARRCPCLTHRAKCRSSGRAPLRDAQRRQLMRTRPCEPLPLHARPWQAPRSDPGAGVPGAAGSLQGAGATAPLPTSQPPSRCARLLKGIASHTMPPAARSARRASACHPAG